MRRVKEILRACDIFLEIITIPEGHSQYIFPNPWAAYVAALLEDPWLNSNFSILLHLLKELNQSIHKKSSLTFRLQGIVRFFFSYVQCPKQKGHYEFFDDYENKSSQLEYYTFWGMRWITTLTKVRQKPEEQPQESRIKKDVWTKKVTKGARIY